MEYLKNHCWCSDSNWGGHYDCTIIVGLNSYKQGYMNDWENLLHRVELEEGHSINQLNDEVIEWLHKNVKDFGGSKGWCIGSTEYIKNDFCSGYSVFFQRRSDAMKFIKTWSEWKKPINYCQYFTDVRKKLDLATGKYIKQ